MPTLPPASERSAAAKAAAHMSWAKAKTTADRSARTEAARAAFHQRFLDEAEGDPVRAQHLRKAHFARLNLKAMQAQRRAKEQATLADALQVELTAVAELERDQ